MRCSPAGTASSRTRRFPSLRPAVTAVPSGARPPALAPQDYALLDLHVRRGLGADELAAGLGVARGALARRLERLQQDLGDYAGLDPATAGRILADLEPGEPPGPRFSPRPPRLPERSKLPKRPNVRKPNVRKPSFRRLNVRRPNLRRLKGRSPLLVAVVVLLAAATTGAVLAAQGGGVNDPAEPTSSSHRLGRPGPNVVAVSWARQPDGRGYSVLWTRDAGDRADETVDLQASATSARSHELDPGKWWFVLRTDTHASQPAGESCSAWAIVCGGAGWYLADR